MTVFCGPSGSGKSSLALDTIYAEGQRRYVESLSSYARQFLGQMQKPRVDHIDGLSPAISIEQKTTSRSPRSTVGTITEIYDYLRILFARLGQRYCPKCDVPVATQSADQVIEQILALPEGTKLYVLAPVERMGQEKYDTIFEDVRKGGLFAGPDRRHHYMPSTPCPRSITAGSTPSKSSWIGTSSRPGHGRGSPRRSSRRWSWARASSTSPSWIRRRTRRSGTSTSYSQHLACGQCGTSYEPLNPHHYSFNGPLGWCNTCEGLGIQRGANVNLLIRDGSLTVKGGAIGAWPELSAESPWLPFAEAIAAHVGFSLDTPYDDLAPGHKKAILHGTGETWMSLNSDFGMRKSESKAKSKKKSESPRPTPHAPRFQYKGLFPALDEAARVSFSYRMRLEHLVDEVPCTSCKGGRLRPDAAATRFADHTMGELCELPLTTTLRVFETLKQTKEEKRVAGELLREIRDRTKFLVDVGLDYLTLGRPGPTLSGGEAQRIRLASQIGSGLTGVLYVLDEPTIGLHPRDNDRLLGALKRLRDLGNTLLVVEHDREVISAADYLLDFGPGAGDRGGEVTASGPPKTVLKSKQSLTGDYLSGRKAIPVPSNRRIAGNLTPRPLRSEGRGRNHFVGYAPGSPAEIAAIAPGGAVLSILGAAEQPSQHRRPPAPRGRRHRHGRERLGQVVAREPRCSTTRSPAS